MDDNQKNAYVAGFGFTLVGGFLTIVAFDIGLNSSGLMTFLFGLAFSSLGVGSFLRPMSIGQVAIQIAENIATNIEKERARRTNTQEMSNSPEGKQIVASEGGKVDMSTHIYNAPPPTKESSQNVQTKVEMDTKSEEKVNCPRCKGNGNVNCTNPNCDEGFIRTYLMPGFKMGEFFPKRRCPDCNGDAHVLCPMCNGERKIVA